MNFKIIETGQDYPDVLLHRGRDENGNETVQLKAIGTFDGMSDMFAQEQVMFSSVELAEIFIKGFTVRQAEQWCKIQQITY